MVEPQSADGSAPDVEPSDLRTALIELRHAREEIDRRRPFVDMVDQAQREAEQADVAITEARMWARHGYEIGQRHCSWTDHGVAPAWLTEGWPLHFDSCEHLKQAAEYDEALTRVRAEVARIRAITRTWWPVADLIEAALRAPSARLLDCGFCYEEHGEEVHPHPECPIGVRTEKQGGPVVGTARIALDAAIVPFSWTATESNGSARQELFSLACQDMPVEPSEVTEAIRAADVELATSIKSYADGRRSSHGELWYDAILEMAVYIATLPPVVAP